MNYSVIKEGDLFLLTEKNGDIYGDNQAGYGLYTKDTRFLNRLEFLIDGESPTLLSTNAEKGYFASFHLMKDKKDAGAIELVRDRFIYQGVLYERVSMINYFPKFIEFEFSAIFDADFQDMFIVRKFRSGKVGEKLETRFEKHRMLISYMGIDGIERKTQINWSEPEPRIDDNGKLSFTISLEPKQVKQIVFTITPILANQIVGNTSFEVALSDLEQSYESWSKETTRVKTNLTEFDNLFNRGVQDLRMLMTDIGYGDVPVAGLPWFAVPFGRDSLITSLFMLPLNPEKVKGTLRTLVAYQGEKVDPWRDEQPGKIMHEIRFGELAVTNQSPFTPYYGTIDATPLFLVVISEYYNWTGDISLIEELMPNIKRALEWIDKYGVRDESKFVTYHQEAEKGFPNQGWKDSSNSIIHDDGAYATSPIALSEVQGYVYQAKKGLAPIVRLLEEEELADQLEREASELKSAFEETFWLEDESFYAIALDENQRQVRSVTSNPGHLLMAGLLEEERAKHVANRLVADDMFNGFGIRTMSTEATGYYPMSYHNGSVWPHDNALCLIGLSRLGFKEEANKVMAGILEASKYFEYQRLPELFCGHQSSIGYTIEYPTTCSPQAWSAGVAIVFLQAMLGLNPNAITRQIQLAPSLLNRMDYLEADNITIGSGELSLIVRRDRLNSSEYQIEIKENTTGFTINMS